MADRPSRAIRGLLLPIAVLAVVGMLFYSANPLTQRAQAFAQDTATASAATYLSLRLVNAFLSTAQEVEVGGSLVVSGTAQPLKWLEPIDDTIERIAGMVFGVMVATGVLAVAMGPVGAVGWALVLLAIVIWALPGRNLHGLARAVAAYGAFLTLALPLAFVVSAGLSQIMTAQVQEQNEAVIAELTSGLDDTASVQTEPQGWWENMQSRLGDVDQARVLAEAIYNNADELIGSYIAVLAVYLFNVVLLPLMLAGAFLILARRVADNRL